MAVVVLDDRDLHDCEEAGDLVEEIDGGIAEAAVGAALGHRDVEFLEQRDHLGETVADVEHGGADGGGLLEHERIAVAAAVFQHVVAIGIAGGDAELLQRAFGIEREGHAVEERDCGRAGGRVHVDVFEGEEFRDTEVAFGDGFEEAIGEHGEEVLN